MWLNLVSLFVHQTEEYRIPGTFPGMLNTALFKSDTPTRYTLNTYSAFVVNVIMGWSAYCLAAFFGEKTVWLGMTTIIISFGNIVAHTTLFNIKGKTIYNAGLITSWIALAPCVYFFFQIGYRDQLITTMDFLIGIPLGIILNVLGIIKVIQWMSDKNSPYIFPQRNML